MRTALRRGRQRRRSQWVGQGAEREAAEALLVGLQCCARAHERRGVGMQGVLDAQAGHQLCALPVLACPPPLPVLWPPERLRIIRTLGGFGMNCSDSVLALAAACMGNYSLMAILSIPVTVRIEAVCCAILGKASTASHLPFQF